MKGDIEMVIGVGVLLLEQLDNYASGEGYKGDGVIFRAVLEVLKKSTEPVIIEACYTQRTFNLIETSFLFQELETLVDGEGWLVGYLHTIHVTREDKLETHSATVLRGTTGKRVIIDWLQPSVWSRDDERENLANITNEHASKGIDSAREFIELLKESVGDIIKDAEAELKKCHIPASGVGGILALLDPEAKVSRYELIKACAEYAVELDYEVADLYSRTAGRILNFGR